MGKKHSPAFEKSLNTLTLTPAKGSDGGVVGTNVTCETRLTVSGFLELFIGKLKAGIAESTKHIFAALRS